MLSAPPSDAWYPTREEGLSRLRRFVPRAGSWYARGRNHDHGPDRRDNVSTLSPWVRHRLVSERETVNDVLQAHSASAAEKFVQEVCWRTYWKGWLEQRPGVWHEYLRSVVRDLDELAGISGYRRAYEDATAGRTGIDCFDAWTRELLEVGYLHNHARMWYASIWIFTLRLPWTLGADFFLRHLMDGDAASNTLSWRWVAGLQTRGKTYRATRENIRRYTGGRFDPGDGLSATATPLPEEEPAVRIAVPRDERPDTELVTGVLINEDDLAPLDDLVSGLAVTAVAGYTCAGQRSPLPTGERAAAFSRGAMDDGLRRAAVDLGGDATDLGDLPSADRAVDWARGAGLQQVVVPYTPMGPAADRLVAIEGGLEQAGVHLVRRLRDWDAAFWPHASRGFFRLKKAIPGTLRELGIPSPAAIASRSA